MAQMFHQENAEMRDFHEVDNEDNVGLDMKTGGTVDGEFDDGLTLLYPDAGMCFPFKTSDRLIDDVLCDLNFVDEHNMRGKPLSATDIYDINRDGILRAPMLMYSRQRNIIEPFLLGNLVDQTILATNYEYSSVTCPEHNTIKIFFGTLINGELLEQIFEKASDVPVYHLKLTVKTRKLLEKSKRHVGVAQFFRIEQLHPYDRLDLMTFDPEDPQLVDHAIYVSQHTNKLILIEIFKPEFNDEDEKASFRPEEIIKRYQLASDVYPTLKEDGKPLPTQLDYINTLFKIFKGPLIRKSDTEPPKTINSDNIVLNSHIDPNWLTTKYGFQAFVRESNAETSENENSIIEYEPPNLTNHAGNWKIRKVRDRYIRKCLQLIFWAKYIIKVAVNVDDSALKESKGFRIFNTMHTNFTRMPWYQLLGEGNPKNIDIHHNISPTDMSSFFIDLSAMYHYTDRDIIFNYETQCRLDPDNIRAYYDALNFIAKRKNSQQLIAYCSKLGIVGKVELEDALRTFNVNPNDIDLNYLDDSFLLSIYKNETKLFDANHNVSDQRLSELKNAMRVLAKSLNSVKLRFYVDYLPYRTIDQAYNILEVNDAVDDDLVQTAYAIKTNDVPGLKLECDRALYTLAIHRRSMNLFDFLVQQCPEFVEFYGPNQFSYRDALNVLKVNENADDDSILKIFQRLWYDEKIYEAEQFLNLKGALTKVAYEKNSKLIQHYLKTGIIDPSMLPLGNWPIGISNIGNTCYLNSLLQYYFCIVPLRKYILSYDKTSSDFERDLRNTEKKRRIGGREVTEVEVERSIMFIYQLRELFNSMIYTNQRYVTPSRELAYLAFAPPGDPIEYEAVQTEHVCDALSESGEKVTTNDKIMETGEVSNHTDGSEDIAMKDMQNVEDLAKQPAKIAKISADQLENALEVGRQQDVTECIGNVLFQLESGAEPIKVEEDNEQYDLIKQLFFGNIQQKIIPLNDKSKPRIKFERFLSLLVNVGDHPRNIYDALDLYFQKESLTMAEYGDVERRLNITEFPQILQIQIQRVYYDREKFMPFKSLEPLPFDQTIYMDRYSATEDTTLLTKQQKYEDIKENLSRLKAEQKKLLYRNEVGFNKSDSTSETLKLLESDFLSEASIDLNDKDLLISELKRQAIQVSERLNALYNEISNLEITLDHIFDDYKEFGYSLFAVFIHRGEASYGHYWIYIKDKSQSGIWRKYNDETVSEVPEEEVFNFTEGNTATPYFLVYVRSVFENQIEPLQRMVQQDNQ